jgi:hypothetical protein
MTAVATDRRQAQELARTMAGRVAALIRPLTDTTVSVPRSLWTVGEHAAHLAYTKDLMARMLAGEPLTFGDGTREGFALANMELLEGYPERNGAVLADRIESAVDAFCRTAAGIPPGAMINSPLGRIPVETFTAYLLAHLMVHGDPMATALNKPRVMDRTSVLASLPFFFLAMERFVDVDAVKGLTASYALHIRGGPSRYVTFDDGRATFSPTRLRRVDCHISADPVALVRVGLRQIEQWGPIATLKLTAWGAKPWLAFRFAGLILPP